MVKLKQVTLRHSAEIAVMYQKCGIRGKKLCEQFPQYSRATIYRNALRPVGSDICIIDKRKQNKGRPSKLTDKEKRRILRAIPTLRKQEGSFTTPRIALEAGLTGKVCNKTIQRVLHGAGYHYLQSRKKGLLYLEDLQERVKFCRKIKSKYKLDNDFWKYQIAFYLDGKGFQYKTNPLDQARAPKAREWRKKGEGLKHRCTAKGKKEGAVNCNFIVGISYDKGVVLCEQYFGAITDKKNG